MNGHLQQMTQICAKRSHSVCHDFISSLAAAATRWEESREFREAAEMLLVEAFPGRKSTFHRINKCSVVWIVFPSSISAAVKG